MGEIMQEFKGAGHTVHLLRAIEPSSDEVMAPPRPQPRQLFDAVVLNSAKVESETT